MKPPTAFRDTLRLFARYRRDQPLEAFFAQLDWRGVGGRQLAHAFLDRPPAAGEHWAEADPRALFESSAFRRGINQRIAAAVPGKQRLLFVHLPKCAGTDFEAALRRTMPMLHPTIESPEAWPPERLAFWLQRIARMLPDVAAIAHGGHVALGTYLDGGLYRWGDRLLTILREPKAIALSMANYVVARFRAHPNLDAIDTRHWAAYLGLARLDPDMPDDDVRALALRVAVTPGIMPVNPLCSLLGDGTCAGALAQFARAPVEFTEIGRYDAWLAERFPGCQSRRANAQTAVIAWSDLAAEQRRAIEQATSEDRVLYDWMMHRLGSRAWAWAGDPG